MSETRVVLVKPGDVLIFGNIGDTEWDDRMQAAVAELKDRLSLSAVWAFEADIDLGAVAEAVPS